MPSQIRWQPSLFRLLSNEIKDKPFSTNVKEVIDAGANGVAVRQSILESENPAETSKKFLAIINRNE